LDGINIESPSPPGSGSSLEALSLIAPLERDLGVPGTAFDKPAKDTTHATAIPKYYAVNVG